MCTENWTDVNGFLMADPHVVDHPRCIRKLTYRELRELSYMGATVLHEDAIYFQYIRRAFRPTSAIPTIRPSRAR